MVVRWQIQFLLILIVGIGLSGCMKNNDLAQDTSPILPLTFGTEVVVDSNDSSHWKDETWTFKRTTQSMGPFGTEEELIQADAGNGRKAIFFHLSREPALMSDILEARRDSVFIDFLLCNVIHPIDFLPFLSGAIVPSVEEKSTLYGEEFFLDVTGAKSHPHLNFYNNRTAINVTADIPSAELVGQVSIEVERLSCKNSRTATLDIIPGEGERIPFKQGISASPYPAELWEDLPKTDIPSAKFPLQRALDRLVEHPQYQEFADGRPTHIVGLNYGTVGFANCAPKEVFWEWEIVVARDDAKVFYACLILPKGLESLPVETTLEADEIETSLALDTVKNVDFRYLDDTVALYSGHNAGSLSGFLYLIEPFSGDSPWSWVHLQRNDPDTQSESLVYSCDLNASVGRIIECNHHSVSTTPCPPSIFDCLKTTAPQSFRDIF